MWPVYNGTVLSHSYTDPPSTVHVVAGMAGCSEVRKTEQSIDSRLTATYVSGTLTQVRKPNSRVVQCSLRYVRLCGVYR